MRLPKALLATLAVSAAAACSNSATPNETTPPHDTTTSPPPPAPKPVAIVVAAGADQIADVDAVLPVRIAVRVNDASGQPIPGVAIVFTATAGGAVVDGASQTTDAAGIATVGNVTLGPTPMTNSIKATAGDVASPAILATARWTARLSSGASSTCAIVANGRAQCWGDDATDQLATNGNQFASLPVGASPTPIVPVPLAGLTAIGTSGGLGFCGALPGGWSCWGRGFGADGFHVTPVPIGGSLQWADVAFGRNSACGLSATGTGYCWGLNQRGEIGSASSTVGQVATSPVGIDGGLSFTMISVGWVHACGLSNDGTAYCWGNNSNGELGNGLPDTVAHKTPVAVQTNERFVQLSLGAQYTCGITVARKALCWGRNASGQLGDGGTTDRSVPTPVAGALSFARIAAGSKITFDTVAKRNNGDWSHTCALTDAGVAYCWGFNASGQVGDGTQIDRAAPVAVATDRRFNAIDANDEATCGMRGSNVWCWGRNDRGQVGDGTFDNVRLVPTAVHFVP